MGIWNLIDQFDRDDAVSETAAEAVSGDTRGSLTRSIITRSCTVKGRLSAAWTTAVELASAAASNSLFIGNP